MPYQKRNALPRALLHNQQPPSFAALEMCEIIASLVSHLTVLQAPEGRAPFLPSPPLCLGSRDMFKV